MLETKNGLKERYGWVLAKPSIPWCQSPLPSFLWLLDSIQHKIWWEVASEFNSDTMQCSLHSSWSKRGQCGEWEERGQMSRGPGLIFCFSCHFLYSFTMRKCRPSSSLRMPALPLRWRMSRARFGMRKMRRCVSRAWPSVGRGQRTGQGQSIAWS